MAVIFTWQDMEPWAQARVRGAVLGYQANKAFLLRQVHDVTAIVPTLEPTGVRGSKRSDPTAAAVMKLHASGNRRIAARAEIAAVDDALAQVLSDIHGATLRRKTAKALMDSFNPRQHNVARRTGLCISERSFWRMRSRFALYIAENLGLL